MTTLSALVSAIDEVIQDDAYDLVARINDAVNVIAGGIRMPNGGTSPPLPDLYKSDSVATTTAAYASLPADYQRNVFNIFDASWNKISAPNGGSYYSFNLFLKQINNLSLAEAGSVYIVAIKGSKLYYQGIPTAPYNIGLHYYRKPVAMALDEDEPDGIPDQFQLRLIKHYVCKEIFGENLEDGQDNAGVGVKYHTSKFYEALQDMADFIGIDAEPQFYGEDNAGSGW